MLEQIEYDIVLMFQPLWYGAQFDSQSIADVGTFEKHYWNKSSVATSRPDNLLQFSFQIGRILATYRLATILAAIDTYFKSDWISNKW